MQRALTNCVTFKRNQSVIVIYRVNQVDTDKHLARALQLQCRNKKIRHGFQRIDLLQACCFNTIVQGNESNRYKPFKSH